MSVSIPHRKFKNQAGVIMMASIQPLFPSLIGSSKTDVKKAAYTNCIGFPSLIGSSKTMFQRAEKLKETEVSIPHRKFKNVGANDERAVTKIVSIPHRKFKNADGLGAIGLIFDCFHPS